MILGNDSWNCDKWFLQDCIVDVLNKGLSNGLGKIFIDSYKDICKYNIRIVSKPIGSEGKKNVGEMTYLNKENITLQTNCACTDVGCMMSHLPFPVTPPVFQAPPPLPSPASPSPSFSYLSCRSQLIEMLVKNTRITKASTASCLSVSLTKR